MPTEPRVVPREVVEAVERYVDGELADARKYDNREPFDDSGVWSLHALAAKIYGLGFEAGETAEHVRARAREQRERERERAESSGSSS